MVARIGYGGDVHSKGLGNKKPLLDCKGRESERGQNIFGIAEKSSPYFLDPGHYYPKKRKNRRGKRIVRELLSVEGGGADFKTLLRA